jgi:DNA gyrase/topoisomerase IV subunit A
MAGKRKPKNAKQDEAKSTETDEAMDKVQALVMEASAVRKPVENIADLLTNETTLNQILKQYLLVDKQSLPLRRVFTNEEVKTSIRLPGMLKDQHTLRTLTSEDILDKSEKNMLVYSPRGLVREVEPTSEFVTTFKSEGFIATQNILLVPYLTKAEEQAYLRDPMGYSTTMATAAWLFHKNRSYFVCDGATRFNLCSANDFGLSAHFLHPSVPYCTMTKLAISSNEV